MHIFYHDAPAQHLHGRIWIVGAGGFGREVFSWTRDALLAQDSALTVAGFLDDVVFANPSRIQALGSAAAHVEVRPMANHQPGPDDWYVCGLGMPWDKHKVMPALCQRGARCLTVIHPTAVIGAHVRLGTGCVICPLTVASTNVVLGDFVVLNTTGAYAGHDCSIGSFSTVSPGASVLGWAAVGQEVLLAVNSSVLPHAVVEDGVTVGAGAIVHKFAERNSTYIGNPARKLEKKS